MITIVKDGDQSPGEYWTGGQVCREVHPSISERTNKGDGEQ